MSECGCACLRALLQAPDSVGQRLRADLTRIQDQSRSPRTRYATSKTCKDSMKRFAPQGSLSLHGCLLCVFTSEGNVATSFVAVYQQPPALGLGALLVGASLCVGCGMLRGSLAWARDLWRRSPPHSILSTQQPSRQNETRSMTQCGLRSFNERQTQHDTQA
eukprot:3110880-Amphidinium_carterae.2